MEITSKKPSELLKEFNEMKQVKFISFEEVFNSDRTDKHFKINYECDHDFIPVNNDGKHKCRFCGEIED